MKVFVDLGGCQGDTCMVGGASNIPHIFDEDRGRFPRRPLHG